MAIGQATRSLPACVGGFCSLGFCDKSMKAAPQRSGKSFALQSDICVGASADADDGSSVPNPRCRMSGFSGRSSFDGAAQVLEVPGPGAVDWLIMGDGP